MKLARFKVGMVSVIEQQTPKRKDTYFELRYTDPSTGRDVRRRMPGNIVGGELPESVSEDRKTRLREVRASADHLDRQARIGKGYLPAQNNIPDIASALADAIRLSSATSYTKRRYLDGANRFRCWLKERYPSVVRWDHLKPMMIQAFVREHEDLGLAWDTVRNMLFPVKMAWRLVAENYNEIRPLPKIRLKPPAPKKNECLGSTELMALLDWLQVHRPELWPLACLQSLAGLRSMEAAALRDIDVDLVNGSITIAETTLHKPKTRSSYRTIPICKELQEVLRSVMLNRKVRPATGELFTNGQGRPHALSGLSLRWTRVFKVAVKTVEEGGCGVEKLKSVPVRKLRSTFANLVRDCGYRDRFMLKLYMGHSARDVLGLHYEAYETEELRPVSAALDEWREVAKRNSSRKTSGSIVPISAVEC